MRKPIRQEGDNRQLKRTNPVPLAPVGRGEGLTKIVVWFPVDKSHLLDAHIRASGTTISARARELLLADMANAAKVPA